MAFMRTALNIATGGLAGLVFKDNSTKEPTTRAPRKQARAQKQTKAAATKSRTVQRTKPGTAKRTKPGTAKRTKPRTAQSTAQRAKPRTAPKPTTDRPTTVAQAVGSGDGTTNELERLADLHVRRALTDEEFVAAKAMILGTGPAPSEPGRGPVAFPAIEANVSAARRLADLAVHDRAAPIASVGGD